MNINRRSFLLGSAAIAVFPEIVFANSAHSMPNLLQFAKTCWKREDGYLLEIKKLHEDILNMLAADNFAAIIKCRQCGATEMSCIYALWKALSYPNEKVAFCTFNWRSCYEITSRLSAACKSLPQWMQSTYKPHETTSLVDEQIRLNNGSTITVVACSALLNNCKNSKNYSTVVFDECAFYDQDCFRQLLEALVNRIDDIDLKFVSTPYEENDLFWHLCEKLKTAGSCLTVDATSVHSTRRLAEIKKALSKCIFEREYECKFLKGADASC